MHKGWTCKLCCIKAGIKEQESYTGVEKVMVEKALHVACMQQAEVEKVPTLALIQWRVHVLCIYILLVLSTLLNT